MKDEETLPIVYATVGEPPYLLFSAHLCHPKPGANDNASGSAMLIELARNLSKMHSQNSKLGFAFLWIPEHIGTSAFVEKFANLQDYYGVINLDMVGGESLMYVQTPLSRFSVLSGVIEMFLDLANSESSPFGDLPIIKTSTHPYEMGSDHDIFNMFGVPAITLITWPDPYYHSSEDSVDKIHKDTVRVIGKTVLASALFLSRENLTRFAQAYKMKYLGEIGMKGNTNIARKLVLHGLWRDSQYLNIRAGKELKDEPSILWIKKGMINTDIISEKNREAYLKFIKNRNNMALIHELLMLGELLPLREAFEALKEEYGAVNKKELRKMLELLEAEEIVKTRE